MEQAGVPGDAASAAAIWKFVALTLSGVVVTLSGALYRLARIAWDERMGRITDRNDTISKLDRARGNPTPNGGTRT